MSSPCFSLPLFLLTRCCQLTTQHTIPWGSVFGIAVLQCKWSQPSSRIGLLRRNLLLRKCVNTLWTGLHRRSTIKTHVCLQKLFLGELSGPYTVLNQPLHTTPSVHYHLSSRLHSVTVRPSNRGTSFDDSIKCFLSVAPCLPWSRWYVAIVAAFCAPQVLISYVRSSRF